MADYNDIWFMDTTNQARNFRRYFIWFVLLFIIVTVGSIFVVKSMYRPIEQIDNKTENPFVGVEEAKVTNVNGYIKGKIINVEQTPIKGKYAKFTFFTKNNVQAGSEYIEIGDLEGLTSKTYEVKFRFSNVNRVEITISDNNK